MEYELDMENDNIPDDDISATEFEMDTDDDICIQKQEPTIRKIDLLKMVTSHHLSINCNIRVA